MRLPSGEICGSAANCRLNTSIAVRRSDFSWDLSSFFSCANPERNSEIRDSTIRLHRHRRCMRCAPRTFVENRVKCTAGKCRIQREASSRYPQLPYRRVTNSEQKSSKICLHHILCEPEPWGPWAQDHKRLHSGEAL